MAHADFQDLIAQAVGFLVQADSIVIAAGAGMGVDSGLPDFRGRAGFWKAYPTLQDAQVGFHQIASPAAFYDDLALAWGFYGHRLALYRGTQPHSGFDVLRRWQTRFPKGLAVFTSNVDGQFQKAGLDAALVHECHGSIHYLQCLHPCTQALWSADSFAPDVNIARLRLRGVAPVCLHCGGPARPNILMFNDSAWLPARSDAQEQRLRHWLRQTRQPVVIELGAGTAIPSVRHFAQRVAREHGAPLIRINPADAALPAGLGVGLALGAAEALLAIDARLAELPGQAQHSLV
ncbi:SIR2 family NAD-dependent protein deacylase [Amphibiibacter pelophylacis]|uniref:Sir2 family NAD-dependent protein deacetylase n=1 Tax=Amphibiibacter pelophylacis TaxID=1799477 RepID=A0ACC6NY33_9BURK